MEDTNTKVCNSCLESKPIRAYYSDRNKKDGLSGRCKSCVRAAQLKPESIQKRRLYNEVHKERLAEVARQRRIAKRDQLREQYRRAMLTKKFGISYQQYDDMLEAQGGVCAICGGVTGYKRLTVDHNHTTGKVRGLLCDLCNRALGNVKENTELLRQMIVYLRRYNINDSADQEVA